MLDMGLYLAALCLALADKDISCSNPRVTGPYQRGVD